MTQDRGHSPFHSNEWILIVTETQIHVALKSEVWSEVKRSEERKEVLIMAAETLLLSNGAVANGDLSSNPNPNPTKKSRDTERRRRRRKQKKNSMASQAPSSDADSNDPQQVSFLFFSFVWDIGICDSKNA